VKRRLSQCFVVMEKGRIAGYYTLSATSIPLEGLPVDLAKRLPRYPSIPAIRMGRLAVDQAFRGQGLGGELLADALARAAGAEVGAYALMVDAKDDGAAAFYRHHGFIPFEDAPHTLFLPLGSLPKP
jgi:GNAT superfamily N-acetyltransferase